GDDPGGCRVRTGQNPGEEAGDPNRVRGSEAVGGKRGGTRVVAPQGDLAWRHDRSRVESDGRAQTGGDICRGDEGRRKAFAGTVGFVGGRVRLRFRVCVARVTLSSVRGQFGGRAGDSAGEPAIPEPRLVFDRPGNTHRGHYPESLSPARHAPEKFVVHPSRLVSTRRTVAVLP